MFCFVSLFVFADFSMTIYCFCCHILDIEGFILVECQIHLRSLTYPGSPTSEPRQYLSSLTFVLTCEALLGRSGAARSVRPGLLQGQAFEYCAVTLCIVEVHFHCSCGHKDFPTGPLPT